MKNKYGEMVGKWEAWYDERSLSTPKRRFDDTPSKSRSIEKKSRSGNSSISGENNTGKSANTGDTRPRSGNRYTSTPTLFSPASRSGNSPIAGDDASCVSSPPLANVSRPNQGDAYTLMPPPLLPESSKSSRRAAATQQGNVGLPGGLPVPSRFTRRSVSGSSRTVQQPAGDSASKAEHLESPSTSRQSARRMPNSYHSSLGQSANTPGSSSNQLGLSPVIDQSAEHSEVRISPSRSGLSNPPDPMDIDTEIQPAEQLRGSRYHLYYSELDDVFEEMVNKFDKVAFEDIINSILEKSGEELEAMTKEAVAELRPGGNVPMVDINGGEYAENPGMILDAYSERLIEAHSKGLRELVDAALDLKGLPCDKWVNKRREDGNLEAESDGTRRYIKGDTQYKVISEWISLVRGRIEFDKFNNRWDEPLSHPISKVGFASSIQRLDQHKKHRYAQAYSSHGGGISHFVAGVSVTNSYKHEEQYWALAKEDLLKSTWFIPSIRKEMMKLREKTSMLRRIYTSAEEQDEQLEEMSESLKQLEVLKESLADGKENFKETTDEYMDMIDPMLELLDLVESGELDD
ncbi:hypothetical protein BOTNAR_0585g00010 [Botryotinia narcissicola]|uniref:Uncharacterized protein n=1 Tax=Botryotinia narcissicola TaxID=278944 RepID=A0A4Z1HNH1_9HELO|nr:hypothetical protein BOTNAR_0585g00010 [Botryotinia narcissicola]